MDIKKLPKGETSETQLENFKRNIATSIVSDFSKLY